MTAPTEAEIRAALTRAWTTPYPVGTWPEAEWDEGFNNGFMSLGAAAWDLDDLRPSELERLDALVSEALTPIRRETEREAIDALVGAMVAFAAEHPDAPRAKREPVLA